MAGSATAQTDYNNAGSCIFSAACPTTGTGVCNASATGYNATTCQNCVTAAQMAGGACYAQIQACLND